MLKGRVYRSTGSWYDVLLESGKKVACRTVGKMRLNTLKVTNPIAVGDYVKVEMLEKEGTGLIKDVYDRENYVIRQSPRKKHFLHILACNIDQAFLIVTIVEPMLKQGFIDRFLLMTEPFNIPVHIIFNKSDLYGEIEQDMYNALQDIYEPIGYHTHLVSAVNRSGVDRLKEILKGKTTLISGQSGVGKSSLINQFQDDMDIKTNELSDYTGKGQHTTTFAEMFSLKQGGDIIDTPGIKTLSFNYLETQDVSHNFREMFQFSENCKFSNCLHRNEPKCAVKQAIDEGSISEYRYFNYLQILEEIEDQNYWEIH
jgi:ribosome biogenesis GTPase